MNFLSTQSENGEIDAKPGLGGQRSRLLAAPLLASLAWRIHRSCEDQAFLEEILPALQNFFWSWFSPAHDYQRDGIPEWNHLLADRLRGQPALRCLASLVAGRGYLHRPHARTDLHAVPRGRLPDEAVGGRREPAK